VRAAEAATSPLERADQSAPTRFRGDRRVKSAD